MDARGCLPPKRRCHRHHPNVPTGGGTFQHTSSGAQHPKRDTPRVQNVERFATREFFRAPFTSDRDTKSHSNTVQVKSESTKDFRNTVGKTAQSFASRGKFRGPIKSATDFHRSATPSLNTPLKVLETAYNYASRAKFRASATDTAQNYATRENFRALPKSAENTHLSETPHLDVPEVTRETAKTSANRENFRDCSRSAANTQTLSNRLPRIKLRIEGRVVPALLDSGASHSFARNHAFTAPRQPSNARHLLTASQAQTNAILGQQTLRCEAGDWKDNIDVLVAEDLREPLICGYDFLEKQRAILDTTRRCLYIGKDHRTAVFYQVGNDTHLSTSVTPLRPDQVSHGFPPHLEPEFAKLLHDFGDVFNDDPAPSTTTAARHKIRLNDDTPFAIRPYRYSEEKKAAIYSQLEQMLRDDIIEPSTSEFASPIVIVKKKDGTPRFCVDYRRLNAATVDEPSPLPIIPDTLKDLGTGKVFSSIDLRSGYWQVPMDESSKRYTAFSTPDGACYQFKVMPFGLKGAPTTFQRMMAQEVLPGLTREFATPYLDDVIIFSDNYEDHVKHLRLVLERLAIHGLRCAPQKCELGKPEVRFLGHIVDGKGQRPQQQHLQQVAEAGPPKSKKELRSFLGMCNWLREYVPRFAEIAAPLTDLLADKKKWTWGDVQRNAFQEIKKALAKPLRLHRPDTTKQLIVQTDASSVGIAAVLYQEIDGEKRVAFTSAKLNPREQRYHINEQECLALVFGIRKFRTYLEDRPFLVRTDSKSLTWLQQTKDSRAKLTRWALELQEFSFQLEHCPGKYNELPDFLSRHPPGELPPPEETADVDIDDKMTPPEDVIACPADIVTLAEEVREAQRNCAETQRLIQMRRDLEEEPNAGWQRGFFRNYIVEDDILFFGPEKKLYVPMDTRQRVLYEHHDTPLAGHPGTEETTRTITEIFHWPSIQKHVKSYVAGCLLCAQYKRRVGQPNAPQRPRQPQRPFEVLSIDIMGPYSRTPNGKRFLLVVTDLFSRWVEAFPLRETSAKTIIQYMEREIFPRFGHPTAIISDNGPQFISQRWLQRCNRWQTTVWHTATYQPRQNPTERRNQELKKLLRLHLHLQDERRWDTKLPETLFNIRRRRNAATGVSPSKMLYGTDLRYPGAWDAPAAETPPEPRADTHQRARENQARYVEVRRVASPNRAPPSYDVNDRVLLRSGPPTGKRPANFKAKWIGPCHITRRLSAHMYLVHTGHRIVKTHVDRLRPAPRRRVPPGN